MLGISHSRTLCLAVMAAGITAAAVEAQTVSSADDQYTVAAGHYAAARWDLAIEEFQTFLTAYAADRRAGDARFYLGEALGQLGRFAEASAVYQRFLDEHPDNAFIPRARFRRGEAAYLTGETQRAAIELNAFVEKHGEHELLAFALPYLGEIALSGNDAPEAQRQYSRALKQFPGGPLRSECQLGLARALEVQSRRMEAERIFRKLADDESSGVADQAQYYLGLMHYRTGKPEQALSLWKSFDSDHVDSRVRSRAMLGRSWALYRLERYAEAQEQLESLVRDQAVGIEAQYWLGLCLRAQDQWRESAKTLVSAALAAPDHELAPAMHFYAGDSLLHIHDHEAATRQFDAVLEGHPQTKWVEDSLFGKLQAAFEADNHGDVDRLASEFQSKFPASDLVSETYLLHGAALKALDKHSDAAEALAKYVKENPDALQTAGARAEIVLCFVHLKDLVKARTAYEQLVKHHPNHKVVLPTTHHLAEAAYAAGDRTWSAELFGKMTRADEDPDFLARGLSGLAWSKLNEGELEKAAELFGNLLEEHPQHPLAAEAALTRAQISEQLEREDAAVAMYHHVIHEYPASDQMPTALFHAARIHEKRDQKQQAATLYERLVNEFSDFEQLDDALYGLAWSLHELDREEESRAQFARLHDEFPNSKYWPDATYRLAQSSSHDGDYDHSTALLTELVKKDIEPDILAHSLYLLGRIAARRELWEDVERPMARLVSEVPDSPLRLPAEYSIAEALYRQRKYDEASQRLEALAEEIAGRRESWLAMVPLRRAQVLVHQEQWSTALKVARQLREDFPDFGRLYEADYLIGRCLAAQGEFEAAREAYQAVIASHQGSKTEISAMAQWMIGETHFHQKNYERARREFLRAEILYAYPKWQAAALMEAGKCHELMNQWRDAAELYLRLLKRYPDSKFTDEAARRLRIAEQRMTTGSAAEGA